MKRGDGKLYVSGHKKFKICKNFIFLLVFGILILLELGFVSAVNYNIDSCCGETGNQYALIMICSFDRAGTWILTKDIDCGSCSDNFHQCTNSPLLPFTGVLDGQGHKISGLRVIVDNTNYIGGIFDYVNGATIKNLNVEIRAVRGGDYTGGIIGSSANGKIENVQVTMGSAYNGIQGILANSYTGGIIGYMSGGSINYSSAKINVRYDDATGSYMGGMIGYATSVAEIKKSYATGNAIGNYQDIGGLVGHVEAATVLIENSYATGNVEADFQYLGGFVGYNKGVIKNSYATGNVLRHDGYSGAFIGMSPTGSSVTNCFATGTVAAGVHGPRSGFIATGVPTVTNSFYVNAYPPEQWGTQTTLSALLLAPPPYASPTHAVYRSTTIWDFMGIWWSNDLILPILRPICGDATCQSEKNENCVTCPSDCACTGSYVCNSTLQTCVRCNTNVDCQDNVNANDASQNGNNGVVYGAQKIAGKVGAAAYNFDGGNDYIDIADSSSLKLTQNFTISAWIYRMADSGNFERILSKSDVSDYDYWLQINQTDSINFGIKKSSTDWISLGLDYKVPLNTWVHITAVKNNTDFAIYINGTLNKTGINDGSPNLLMGDTRTSNKPLQIGRLGLSSVWYYGFNGNIDEVKIWNRSLSASEVLQEYQRTEPRTLSNEIAYYAFEGNNCDGIETCFENACYPGTPITCSDSFGCTTDSCDSGLGICRYIQKDCGGANCLEPSGLCSYVSGIYFASVNNTKDKIKTADLNDLVRLYVSGQGLRDKVDYDVWKSVSWWFDKKIVQGTSEGYTTWRAGLNANGTLESGQYWFRAKPYGATLWNKTTDNPDANYRYLQVSASENNFVPFVNITSPNDGEIYLTSETVEFRQSSFDEDDFIDYVWDLGDGITKAGDSINYENYDFNFNSYTSSGQKNIRLDVVDGRGARVSDSRSIFVIDINKVANYTFAYITQPKWGENVNGPLVRFNATKSFAIEVNISKNITCIGGDCPVATKGGTTFYNSYGLKGNYSNMNFSWSFDDGDRYYIKGANGTNFTKAFGKTGQHNAELNVIMPTANSLADTSFSVTFLNYCEADGLKYWNGSGISFNTLTSSVGCGGTNKAPGGNDDCCPANFGCTPAGCVLNLTIQSFCANKSFCSDYKDSMNCSLDLCRVGSDSACGGIVQANTNCNDDYFVKINCSCKYIGTSPSGKCELNSQIRGSIFQLGDELIYSCNTTTEHGNCLESGFMRVQMNSTITGAPAGCNLNDSLCTNEQGSVVCGAARVRLPFFTFFNFIFSIILIAVIYIILGFGRK